MFGRTNTFTTYGGSDTSPCERTTARGRVGKGEIREHIARRLLCATSRRAGGVNGAKGVYRGIVGVGKLKAEAPRRRSGQPTPRRWAGKKRGKKKIKKKESEGARRRERAVFAAVRSREFVGVWHSGNCAFRGDV